MADESDVVKQELGHENGQENDQEMASQEPESELKPDVDELMRKIEEEKEKRLCSRLLVIQKRSLYYMVC